MNRRRPWDTAAADRHGGTAPFAEVIRPGRRLIATMLLAAAGLDISRCGLVLMTSRHPAPTAGLVAAGLAEAALTARIACGYRASQRWAGWAALLIGVASAPQAAASGFHTPYTIPDVATAALGVLLAVTVLATAGPTTQPGLAMRAATVGAWRPYPAAWRLARSPSGHAGSAGQWPRWLVPVGRFATASVPGPAAGASPSCDGRPAFPPDPEQPSPMERSTKCESSQRQIGCCDVVSEEGSSP
jgi:hypothetical protein